MIELNNTIVVIRFQICIFDILNTASKIGRIGLRSFQICIFDILNTARGRQSRAGIRL